MVNDLNTIKTPLETNKSHVSLLCKTVNNNGCQYLRIVKNKMQCVLDDAFCLDFGEKQAQKKDLKTQLQKTRKNIINGRLLRERENDNEDEEE